MKLNPSVWEALHSWASFCREASVWPLLYRYLFTQSLFLQEEEGVVVTEKDPNSQGKEGSLWPERVILMDTRLPSRRQGTVKRGWGGEQGSNENHPSISWRQWRRERKRGFEALEAFPEARQAISWEGCLSPSFSLCMLIYSISSRSFTSVLN